MNGGPLYDYKRLTGFLTARGARQDCPSCGVNKWKPFGPEKVNGLFLPGTDAEGRLLEAGQTRGGLGVYCLTCSNCGFVRLHSIEVVNEESEGETH